MPVNYLVVCIVPRGYAPESPRLAAPSALASLARDLLLTVQPSINKA